MSVRYEGTHVEHCSLSYAVAGTRVGEDVVKAGALLIGYDEVFYVEGSPDDLRRFAERILRVVPGGE